MRRIFFLFLTLTLLSFVSMSAQNRREARKMCREQDSVNIGYGYVKKKSLTNSVAKVKIDELQMGSYMNIGEYLKGRVPGLQVMRVGDKYQYRIRGVNSFNATIDPLFVVDGVEVLDINYLNPRDVSSVEILKDASASIYGSRGACGVILITTRRQ